MPNIKTGTGKINDIEYVSISEEPHHSILYRNNFICVYLAAISPGNKTQYHRHSENTLYVVLEGGYSSTLTLGNPKGDSYAFPKSFGFHKKLWREISSRLTGAVYLSAHSFFLMMNKNRPVIHQVVASNKNRKDLRFLGIEIMNVGTSQYGTSLKNQLLRNEYETDDFIVFKLKLKKGRHLELTDCGFPIILIVTKGYANVKRQSSNSTPSSETVLQEGDFYWFDRNNFTGVSTFDDANTEALVIALK
jgi:hypothetical protein